jgi:hypothetical protein
MAPGARRQPTSLGTMKTRFRRLRATLVAPIAAPAVVWMGFLTTAITTTHQADHTDPVAGWLFVAFALFLYGFPAALAATTAILLPASIVLERNPVARTPILVSIGAIGGTVLMPAYLHVLAPRGTFSLFPGAGAAAGAAVALLFCRLSRQPVSK